MSEVVAEDAQIIEEQPTQEQELPQVTLSDMIDVINLIDTCSKRGAFAGEELEGVGNLRNKIARFVDSFRPQEGDEPSAEVADDQASEEQVAAAE